MVLENVFRITNLIKYFFPYLEHTWYFIPWGLSILSLSVMRMQILVCFFFVCRAYKWLSCWSLKVGPLKNSVLLCEPVGREVLQVGQSFWLRCDCCWSWGGFLRKDLERVSNYSLIFLHLREFKFHWEAISHLWGA